MRCSSVPTWRLVKTYSVNFEGLLNRHLTVKLKSLYSVRLKNHLHLKQDVRLLFCNKYGMGKDSFDCICVYSLESVNMCIILWTRRNFTIKWRKSLSIEIHWISYTYLTYLISHAYYVSFLRFLVMEITGVVVAFLCKYESRIKRSRTSSYRLQAATIRLYASWTTLRRSALILTRM